MNLYPAKCAQAKSLPTWPMPSSLPPLTLAENPKPLSSTSGLFLSMTLSQLTQAGMIANKILQKRLNIEGCYYAATTPGFCCRKWRPILFVLFVNDFGIEYVGDHHVHHLQDVLNSHYTITKYWEVTNFSCISFEWYYIKLMCHLSMNGYIQGVLYCYHLM